MWRDSIASRRWHGWLLLLGGMAGLTSAIALTIEDFKRLTHPGYVPSCSINPVLSCGSVMATRQAVVFGFPNPILGLSTFAVVVTTAVLVLAGIALPRWYWAGLTLGSAFGVGFVCWLIFQSLYRIHALCPYCMVVWAFTPVVGITAFGRAAAYSRGAIRLAVRWRVMALVVYYLTVLLLVYIQFRDYWDSLLL